MTDPKSDLIDLAAVVADGDKPDWDRAASHADSERARSIVEHLREIADIGRLHAAVSPGVGDGTYGRLEPGTTWGSLQILEHVGAGRFGDVYRAFDPGLHREVALKLLRERDGESNDDAFVVHEGRLAARVRHPNVVTVYGAQRIGDRTGVWMEFVVGRTLEAELAADGPFDTGTLAHVATDLCGALVAVHEAGLLHRDVKASNVMRDAGGRVVLGDFGTGRELIEGDDLRVGVAGTPAYIAPEIFRGAPATVQSDLYSFGVLLFHLATNDFPIRGHSLSDVRSAHSSGKARKIRDLRTDLDRRLADVIDRALDPDPPRRFDSARAMAQWFVVRPRGHRPAIAGAVVLSTLVALAILVMQANRDGAPPDRTGISFEQVNPEVQRQARFRGPAVRGLVTCSKIGGSHVALCNLADRSIEVLRASGPKSFAPAGSSQLSPDGSQVAYVWVESEGPRQPEADTLNVMTLNGRQNKVLQYVYPGSFQIRRWTADGTAILAIQSTLEGGRQLMLVPTDGRPRQVIRRLVPGETDPDLSPDGHTLILAKSVARNDRDVIAIDARTGEERWRLANPADDFAPVWTPDGSGVVFVSDRQGGHSLMLVPVAHNRPGAVIILRDLGRSTIKPLAFGGDGGLYTLVTGPPRTTFLVTIDIDKGIVGTPGPLEPRAVEDSLGAEWSPDGRRIAYLSGRAGDPQSNARLIVRDVNGDGQQVFQLTGFMTNFGMQARWAPNGRTILVSHLEKGVGKKGVALDVINPDTRSVRRLVTDSGAEHPRWDPNGQSIYFREVEALLRLELGTGKVTTVRPAGPPNPRLLPFGGFDVSRVDGSWLLITATSGERKTGQRPCTVRRETPGEPPVEVALDTIDCPSVLALDGKRALVFSQLNQDTGTLWLVNLETRQRAQLPLTATAVVDLSLSPDGRQLLYTAGNAFPEMWVLRLPRAK